jgi:outer membrane receptor protein involved in Fe transport
MTFAYESGKTRSRRQPVRYKALASAVAAACAAAVAGPSLAQQADAPAQETIRVTGTYIERAADRPTPVAILDQIEIQAQQRVTMAEVVRDMPQITSANTTSNWEAATNSINLRGLGARSTLVLLNGQRMTIDANAGSAVDVNNLAPTIMVERMELLLDGASALYGSDAVAGVANFITRDRFEGFEFNLSSQWADTQTDVPEIVAGGIFGTGDDDSHLVLAVELQRRDDKLQEEDRFDDARLAYGLQTALWNPGSYLGAGGWFADPLCGSTEIGGNGRNDPSNPAGYKRTAGPDFCRGNLSLQRTNTPEMSNLLAMAVFTQDFEFGGLETFRVEAGFARADSQSSFGTGVPLLALPSVSGAGPILPTSNPGVYDAWYRSGGRGINGGSPVGGTLDTDYTNGTFPYQGYSRIFSRQLSPLDGDAASLDSSTVQNTYRTAASLEGVFGDSTWDWRVNGTFSQNDQKNNPLDTITDRYMRAVQGYGGPACKWNFVEGVENNDAVQAGVGPCQYWNPFASRLIADPTDNNPINPADPNSPVGADLYNSPELLDWMMFGGQNLNESRFTAFEAIVTGELWEMGGGATGIAVGAQYRKQELEIGVDPIQKDGGFGFSPQILRDWTSNRDTDAVFAELVMFPTQNWEVDIAVRWEETLGLSSTDPKVSTLWTPTDRLFFRASIGSSFRLASENQLFGIGGGSVGRDTLGGEVTQAVGIAVGNPNLVPEESDNWTIGVTWDITDNFTVDLTYWDYEFTNLATTTDAEDTLRADLLDGYINVDGPIDWNNAADVAANAASPHPLFFGRPNEFCDPTGPEYVPGGTGRWDGASALPAGCLTGFDIEIFRSSFINQNVVLTNGYDLTLDWRRDFSQGGTFGARFMGSFTEEYAGIAAATGLVTDVVGTTGDGVAGIGTNPDLRANLIYTYTKGDHNFRATQRYTAGSQNLDPNILEAPFDEGSYTQWDLVYNWALPLDNPATLTFSILNATDEEPPLDPNGLITYNAGLYDGRGRMFRLQWSQGF